MRALRVSVQALTEGKSARRVDIPNVLLLPIWRDYQRRDWT
jgi:hypothetical protein